MSTSTPTRQTSERRRLPTLNPRRIQTGLPGIRRTVYDGALRVNSDAYDVLSSAVGDVVAAGQNDSNNLNSNSVNTISGNDMALLQAKPEWRKYFPLNALLRPSIDDTPNNNNTTNNNTVKKVKITQLTNQTITTHHARIVNEATGERAMCAVESVQTVARDCVVDVLDAGIYHEEEEVIGGANLQEGEEVVVLRGGGDDDIDTTATVTAGSGGDDVNNSNEKSDDANHNNNNNDDDMNVDDKDKNDTDGDIVMTEAVEEKETEGGGEAAVSDAANPIAVDDETNANSNANNDDNVEGGASQSDAVSATTTVEVAVPNTTPSAQGEEVVEVKAATQEAQTDSAVATTTTTTAAETATAETATAETTTAIAQDVEKQEVTSDVAAVEKEDNAATIPSASVPVDSTKATDAVPTTATSSSGVTTNTDTATTDTADSTAADSTTAPTTAEAEATSVKSTNVQPLPANHPPLSTTIPLPKDITPPTPPNAPSWYNPTITSTTEKSSLPEWFNSSAPHRTPDTYLSTRNQILNLYQAQLSDNSTTTNNTTTASNSTGNAAQPPQQQQQFYLTSTAIRRVVPGDAGSLLRLHSFLCDWGLINAKDLGDNSPSDLVLRVGKTSGGKRTFDEVRRGMFWSKERLDKLDGAVVKYVKTSGGDGEGGAEGGVPQQQQTTSVDWEAVAKEIGEGVSALDCQRAFLDPPSNDEVSAKIAKTAPSGFDLSTLLDGVNPDVLQATVNASLKATNNITEARKASIAGILASTAATKARSEEEEIARTLMDILNQRMERLENRVAILDDVEALLEAERVALELERRDMYTTRCRHWFGDGSS